MPAKTVRAQLKEYLSKRDFRSSPEPSVGSRATVRRRSALRFVVQKHDATRVHFDFRLELDGVLKSWAITRGPSDNPADKRLAVRVEDHPIEYGTFEGVIPEGDYGGGTVMLWDSGTWEPVGDPHEGLESGSVRMRLNGKRMKGEWVLVHMKGRAKGKRENWLLIKHKDEFARPEETLIRRFNTSITTGRDFEAIANARSSGRKVATSSTEQARRRGPARDTAVEPTVADPPPEGERLTDQAGLAAAERAGVHLTSPTRVIYPAQGVSKATLVAYYAAVAERMLPYIANRPLSLVRCPQGRAKACFYQKHDPGGFPGEMKTILIREKGGERKNYFHIDDLPGLIAGTQMNVMEWHVWGVRCDDLERPDRIVFDIDPGEGMSFASVRDAAREIRRTLESVGLRSFPLITGGKGIHVVAPLVRRARWPEVKAFCRAFAEGLASAEPVRFIATPSKAKRKGKLFIDYLRNERGATGIAPWSSRSRRGAPVATPMHWDELDTVRAADEVSLAEAVERASAQDPWHGYASVQQTITQPMLALAGAGTQG